MTDIYNIHLYSVHHNGIVCRQQSNFALPFMVKWPKLYTPYPCAHLCSLDAVVANLAYDYIRVS